MYEYGCCSMKGFIREINIGIERRQFQSTSVNFSDWGSLRLPQSEALDYPSISIDTVSTNMYG